MILLNHLQFDPDEGGEVASTPEFLLRCLLGARSEADRPSNEGGYDEDVNVYLVGLLQELLSARYHERTRRYHFVRDLDLAREVERVADDRFAYWAYRTNADHLLLAIGLFHHVEGAQRPGRPLLHREPEEFIGRGETYYHVASNLLRRLRRRSSGPEVAMSKLSEDFETYVEILRHVRTSYFHLCSRMGEGELYHLMRSQPEDEGGELTVEDHYDRFLDAFSAWKRERSAEAHERLRRRADALREADPDFRFRLPPVEEIRGPSEGGGADDTPPGGGFDA